MRTPLKVAIDQIACVAVSTAYLIRTGIEIDRNETPFLSQDMRSDWPEFSQKLGNLLDVQRSGQPTTNDDLTSDELDAVSSLSDIDEYARYVAMQAIASENLSRDQLRRIFAY